MSGSTFVPPEFSRTDLSPKEQEDRLREMKAENSLHTTPAAYAHFMAAWMNDKELRDMAFKKPVSMQMDKWAAAQGLDEKDLKQLAWGHGIALQLDEKGEKVINVYHWGDMNEWRAFVGYDIDKKEGLVFAANSKDGLILLDDAKAIVAPDTDFKLPLKYIFEKLGFTRNVEPDWEEKEGVRVRKIISKYELNKEELVENGSLIIINNKGKNTLSIECKPNCAILNSAIYNEYQAFVEKNGMQAPNYSSPVIPVKDKDGNIVKLEIHISDPKLYNQFIERLNKEGLLPPEKFIFADKQQKQSISTSTILMKMSPDKTAAEIKEDSISAKKSENKSIEITAESKSHEVKQEKDEIVSAPSEKKEQAIGLPNPLKMVPKPGGSE